MTVCKLFIVFLLLAQGLERKTVSDCVQYYYLSKKAENFKKQIRLSKNGRRGKAKPPPAPTQVIDTAPQMKTRHQLKEELMNKGKDSGGNNSKGNSRPNTPGVAGGVKNGDTINVK